MAGLSIRDQITLLVVTSPLHIHPKTEIIDRMLCSVDTQSQGMLSRGGVRCIVCCDSYMISGPAQDQVNGSVTSENSTSCTTSAGSPQAGSQPVPCRTKRKHKTKTRRLFGRVTKEQARNYEEYLRNLGTQYGARVLQVAGEDVTEWVEELPRDTSASIDMTLVKMKEWCGLARGIRTVMMHPSVISTPMVLISPHDLEFQHPLQLSAVCATLQNDKNSIRYIGYPNANSLGRRYINRYRDAKKWGKVLEITPFRVDQDGNTLEGTQTESNTEDGLVLVPLLIWKDNPHVALTSHYRDFVFSPEVRFKRGDFIESQFGQQVREAVKEKGLAAHEPYGTFLLYVDDDCYGSAWTYHIDGKGYKPVDERVEKGDVHVPMFEVERWKECCAWKAEICARSSE